MTWGYCSVVEHSTAAREMFASIPYVPCNVLSWHYVFLSFAEIIRPSYKLWYKKNRWIIMQFVLSITIPCWPNSCNKIQEKAFISCFSNSFLIYTVYVVQSFVFVSSVDVSHGHSSVVEHSTSDREVSRLIPDIPFNLLVFDISYFVTWRILFGHLTMYEIIKLKLTPKLCTSIYILHFRVSQFHNKIQEKTIISCSINR